MCENQLNELNLTIQSLQEELDACGCSCTKSEVVSGSLEDLPIRIGAIFIVLTAASLGVLIPLAGNKFPSLRFYSYLLTLAKHFGTGIIVSTALIHMLNPAVEALGSKCLEDFIQGYDALGYLFCTIAIFLMHALDSILVLAFTSPNVDRGREEEVPEGAVDDKGEERSAPSSPTVDSNGMVQQHHHHNHYLDTGDGIGSSELMIQAYMLEFGFTIHSIFIGVAVGVSHEGFYSLLIALVFHQFFEGIGLGSRLADPGMRISNLNTFILVLIFALSAPLGLVIGVSFIQTIDSNGQSFLIVTGILDALCAGVLLYVGFMLIFHDFAKDSKIACIGKRKGWKRFGLYLALWSGVGVMAGLGKFL